LIQPSALALCHTKRFDELGLFDRKHQDITIFQDIYQTGYSRLPATAFSSWRGFILYPILSIAVIEDHIPRNIKVSDLQEWGQSLTIITCACEILHWIYVNSPFLKHRFVCFWRGSWIPAKGPILSTNIMRLIAIGAPPSLIGEENYKLLTTDKPE